MTPPADVLFSNTIHTISYSILVTHNDLLCLISWKPLLCLNSNRRETKNDSHRRTSMCTYIVRTFFLCESFIVILRINDWIYSSTRCDRKQNKKSSLCPRPVMRVVRNVYSVDNVQIMCLINCHVALFVETC